MNRNRYVRQEALTEIGKAGQALLGKSSVAVIGMGALGSCTAEMLVRAGVGRVLLVDKDKVDFVNLQRQMLFEEKDVGKSKVKVASEKLKRINSEVVVEFEEVFLSTENSSILDAYDLILDCTDNMFARHIINDYCERNKKTWIYSAVVGTKGNVLVVQDCKKFRQVFKSAESFDNCENLGVVNSAVTMTSSIQVSEALKFLVKNGVSKQLIRFDAWKNEFEKIKI